MHSIMLIMLEQPSLPFINCTESTVSANMCRHCHIRATENGYKTCQHCRDAAYAGKLRLHGIPIPKPKVIRSLSEPVLCACGKLASQRARKRANQEKYIVFSTQCYKCSGRCCKQKSCAFCGNIFNGRKKKLYCSHKCRLAASERDSGKIRSQNGRLRKLTAVKYCSACGKQISRGSKYCSECGRIHKMNDTAKRQAAPRICKLCGRPWKQKTKADYKLQPNGRACCGRQGKYCPACLQIQNGILKYGNEWEPVDRIAVFERDNWHCGICGIETPRSLCGTGLPNEPTLEHILPQVLGGAHSYKNCGLSCRDCNSKKRDKIELEPRLKGVTDYSPYKVAKFRAQQQDQQQALCACGCGEYFMPKLGNKTGCKHGHWYMTEAGQQHIAEMSVSEQHRRISISTVTIPFGRSGKRIKDLTAEEHKDYMSCYKKLYVPLEVDPNSRLGKIQKAMHDSQERLQSKAVEQSTAKHRQPIKRARTAAQMRVADHTALYQSGLCASEFVKQSLLSPLPS